MLKISARHFFENAFTWSHHKLSENLRTFFRSNSAHIMQRQTFNFFYKASYQDVFQTGYRQMPYKSLRQEHEVSISAKFPIFVVDFFVPSSVLNGGEKILSRTRKKVTKNFQTKGCKRALSSNFQLVLEQDKLYKIINAVSGRKLKQIWREKWVLHFQA